MPKLISSINRIFAGLLIFSGLVFSLPLPAEAQSTRLRRPQEVELKGNVRREIMSSPIGKINVRWPRKVESMFGRTPMRALQDSANTVSRTIRRSGFPTYIQSLNLEWNVVFMDQRSLQNQVPTSLVSNCHPGWMTPPANIYIVAERVAEGCGGKSRGTSVADSELARVLVHEMGHAVEFALLNYTGALDRKRIEGFATWFVRYAAESSSLLSSRALTRKHFEWAKVNLKRQPRVFQFAGGASDYARASMYIQAIVERRGVNGLMDVYDLMRNKGVSYETAVSKKLYWNPGKLEREVNALIEKNSKR